MTLKHSKSTITTRILLLTNVIATSILLMIMSVMMRVSMTRHLSISMLFEYGFGLCPCLEYLILVVLQYLLEFMWSFLVSLLKR